MRRPEPTGPRPRSPAAAAASHLASPAPTSHS
jgi:hypothetical protein